MNNVVKMPTRSKALALRCTACGVEASASCSCGVAYEPASAVAARALKANPTRSNRAIAEMVGVHPSTVDVIRKSTAGFPAVEKTIGRDGKERPATMPRRPKPEVILLEPLDYTLHMFTTHVLPWLEQLDEDDKIEFWKRIRKETQS